MEFGEKITALRKSHGMTQSELGAELNVTFQAVSKWELGESLPDFATMSKMAKLFGVPLGFFEEGGEDESSYEAAADGGGTMLGVCTQCGRVVYEGQEESVTPVIICKDCAERQRMIYKRKQAELKQKKEKEEKEARAAQEAHRFALRRKRKNGLIAGGAVAGAWFVLLIISLATLKNKSELGDTILGGIVLVVFSFTFVSQLVWGGAVRDMCLRGGAIIGTPGVIFTLDFEGCFFLIGVKLLFALLKLLIFLLTSAFFVLIGYLMSPFSFVPRLLALNREI